MRVPLPLLWCLSECAHSDNHHQREASVSGAPGTGTAYARSCAPGGLILSRRWSPVVVLLDGLGEGRLSVWSSDVVPVLPVSRSHLRSRRTTLGRTLGRTLGGLRCV